MFGWARRHSFGVVVTRLTPRLALVLVRIVAGQKIHVFKGVLAAKSDSSNVLICQELPHTDPERVVMRPAQCAPHVGRHFPVQCPSEHGVTNHTDTHSGFPSRLLARIRASFLIAVAHQQLRVSPRAFHWSPTLPDFIKTSRKKLNFSDLSESQSTHNVRLTE